MRLIVNPAASLEAYTAAEANIVSRGLAEAARAEISTWPGYSPSPLRDLGQLARELDVGHVLYKDESERFGQGSFKVLGGAYAAELILKPQAGAPPPTLCCATDGNHGRSVAFAARKHGSPCMVLMHAGAPAEKAAAIQALGARVVRIDGNYDDSVRLAEEMAIQNGWTLIPDTCTDPLDPTTRLVMQGYGVMVLELLEQLDGCRLTHVVLQGGVGGLAAGVAGVLADVLGAERPRVIVVEPDAAACLFESATRFAPSRVAGDLVTAMEMLSTGEASPVAWPILQKRADAFVTLPDVSAIAAAHRLRETGVDVGVSGAAGVAGLIEIARHPAARRALRLDASSNILVFGTEGADGQDPIEPATTS
jgi:diaminopropionate ammonia-lyase